MKTLKVNFDDIQKAMEDVSRDMFDYFFDVETGQVISFSEEIMREITSRLYDNDFEDIGEGIEYIEFDEEPDLPDWMLDEVELVLEVLLNREVRYVHIPERRTSDAYQSMVDFIGKIENPVLKEELSNALNGKGAFRKFKDVLVNYPKERKLWHGYNTKTIKREIRAWLKSLGVNSIS